MTTLDQAPVTLDTEIGPPAGLVARHRKAPPPPHEGLHYGWWIVLSAMLSVFVSLGVGRFALGMLLPAMGEALNLSYMQMGWISSANFVGYLLGAIWVRQLLPMFGERRLITMALLTIVVTMVGVSLANGFFPLVILYTGTGLGSGVAFVCAVTLIPHWFATAYRGRASGSISVGAGFAVILAGWAIPMVNSGMGDIGWRLGWGGLAAVCLPLALFCLVMVRNRPSDMGLQPFGADPDDYRTGHNLTKPIPRAAARFRGAALRRLILRLGAVYFLFGATYVVYITFIVTTLVHEHGMAEGKAGFFWIWVGFFSLFCGPVLGALSDRLGRRTGIITAFILQGCAYTLISYSGGNEMVIYLSVFLFGLSAFGLPVIITASVADYLTPERAVGAIGMLTVIFGIGQLLGPILAGLMAEYSGTFTPAYLGATSLVALAIAVTLTLPEPAK
ncbi:MAG: YbfB/YjiJ family MFS transporter [Rhodospirillaceae bacterium]|jgi:MFS family permease|nr:YbfB/YjiJ family MFS transporter [Rhodospirillaceae bacterium]MBT4687064.1 YbfB/YjiJ family MFS transporter [Rhodospirillaceae bacterium]MBT5082580.1 YbfB/YjiJ family MFS transporter [Rhodospirillaceae bacterium]MBT5526090.1 YbfB/YjiJ family MFS transporter [Rhodospirillaceae bacterium]MBT5879619.1 YbfB/YjiJ family MFS transporter [Rhodospirillaceae bacterium]